MAPPGNSAIHEEENRMTTLSNSTAFDKTSADKPPTGKPIVAPISMMTIADMALQDARAADTGLPRMICLSGDPGRGKSYALRFGVAQHNAIYVRAFDSWTRRSLFEAVVHAIAPQEPLAGTTNRLFEQAVTMLRATRTALAIDEFDYVVKIRAVDAVRDLHDEADIPILMVGEKSLPGKLQRWPRVHSRIAQFVSAVPASLSDAKKLSQAYVRRVNIADDLLAHFVDRTDGNVRRICTALEETQRQAVSEGVATPDLAWFDSRRFEVLESELQFGNRRSPGS
jgi:DNA transposition AAA+ family ATPase